jgi:hypothetical protein
MHTLVSTTAEPTVTVFCKESAPATVLGALIVVGLEYKACEADMLPTAR